MVERKRDRLLQVRMHDVEVEMLDVVADSEGLTASEWVRQAIRHRYSELPPKKSRRKAKA